MKATRHPMAVLLAMIALGSWSGDASAQGRQKAVDRGPLLTWAHRITSTKGWSVWDYAWLSNDSILAFHLVPGTTGVDQAFEVDVRTRHQQPLEGFNQELRQLKGVSRWALHPVLSPDHRWLFWYDAKMGSPGTKWLALRLDGSQAVVGNTSYFWVTGGVWSQHSDEWIALFGYKGQLKAIHYSLASPEAPLHEAPIADTSDLDHFSPILGLTPTGEAILDDAQLYRTGSLRFLTVDVQAGQRPTRTWNVASPRGSQAEWTRVVLSPHADRLAWLLCFDKPDRNRRLTKRCRATFEIWISELNGSKMHMVGYQPVKRIKHHIYADALLALGWLPDGKHLSFTTWSVSNHSEDALYTIPAN